MYKLIPLLLLVFLFACDKNPVNNAQSQDSGNMSIEVTTDPGAAKTAYNPTVSAKAFIVGPTTKTIDLPLNALLQFLVPDTVVLIGTYAVTIKGYDSDGNVTWIGSKSGVEVFPNKTAYVKVTLYRP